MGTDAPRTIEINRSVSLEMNKAVQVRVAWYVDLEEVST